MTPFFEIDYNFPHLKTQEFVTKSNHLMNLLCMFSTFYCYFVSKNDPLIAAVIVTDTKFCCVRVLWVFLVWNKNFSLYLQDISCFLNINMVRILFRRFYNRNWTKRVSWKLETDFDFWSSGKHLLVSKMHARIFREFVKLIAI